MEDEWRMDWWMDGWVLEIKALQVKRTEAEVKKHEITLQWVVKHVLILCVGYQERRLKVKKEAYCIWILGLQGLDFILYASNILEECKMVERLEDKLDQWQGSPWSLPCHFTEIHPLCFRCQALVIKLEFSAKVIIHILNIEAFPNAYIDRHSIKKSKCFP